MLPSDPEPVARSLFRATLLRAVPMNRRQGVARASSCLALALPLALLACSSSFTAGPGDGAEAGADEGGIVFGDGGSHEAATRDAGVADTVVDARHDAPGQPDAKTDGPGLSDGPTIETGGGCPPGSFTCSDGGCAEPGPANCGGCGITCSGTTPVCSSTGCVSGCPGGEIPCNGACVDSTNDPNHCNGCNNVCPEGPSNSQATCANGTCGWTCAPDYEQCGNTCLLAVPDAVHGVFVAQGGATTSCGAESAPCSTISAALDAVAQSGGTKDIVYVAQSSTPYVEQVTLIAGVTVQGGWGYLGGGQWSRPCALDPSQVVVQAPASDDRVVVASYAGSATLDTLTIANETTAVAGTATTPGQTLYGIFAANAQPGQTSLTLTNVHVTVSPGGPGGNGAQGAAGGPPPASCSAGNGSNGGPGPGGAGASWGTYAVDGYHPASGATATSGGTAGNNGAAAPGIGQTGGPQCVDVYPSSITTNVDCCGSTGNGCTICSGTASVQQCGGVGNPGCGSGGSLPGQGGTGGGGSIGVYSFNTALVAWSVSITTGAGGAGGNGGPGGNVFPGSTGSAGSSSSYVTSCQTTTTTWACKPTALGTLVGSTGGKGGMGGLGGQGGGGSGGNSGCILGNSAPGSAWVSSTCSAGSGGVGGNAGLWNEGRAGVSGL